jgi:hypothetical protein
MAGSLLFPWGSPQHGIRWVIPLSTLVGARGASPSGPEGGAPLGFSPSLWGPLEEEDGLLAVLGGRRDPVYRVRHLGGEAVGEVR